MILLTSTGVPVNRFFRLLPVLALALPLFAQDKPEPFGNSDDINGVRVFRVEGSPEEIGRKVGKNFRDEIAYLFKGYFETYTDDPELRDKFVENAVRLEKFLSDDERAELKGLAAGAGLEFGKVLIVHTFLDAIRVVNCSTFVLEPPATKNDTVIFGRNLDFPDRGVAHKHSMVMVYRPDGKYAFASVTWPGMAGVLSGMNEHGLCLAVMNVYNKKDTVKGVPYVLLFRRVLENCRTFDEAKKLLEKTDRTCGNNLMVVDASGKCGVFELDHEQCKVREPEEGAVIATNHWRLDPANESQTCPRWFRLNQLEKAWHGKIGMNEAKKMLQAVPQGEMTLQSMLFLPKDRELYLAVGELPATKGKFRKVEGLFRESDAPVK
jgi:isopenicillin-N N-acyltransferase-like protein